MPHVNTSVGISLFLLISSVSMGRTAETRDATGVVWPQPSGKVSISGRLVSGLITVGISRRTAGAIDSLVWKGKEFVNKSDHGREIQSASYYDRKGACENPTEAGSAADGTGPETTSKLTYLSTKNNVLKTKTQMAYWLGPGGQAKECNGARSTVSSRLSRDSLTKAIEIGSHGIPNAISFDVSFDLEEKHNYGVFEALTGYMPPDFRNFWKYNLKDNSLTKEPDQQGSQTSPLIVSTDDGDYSIAIVSGGPPAPTYGRWNFTQATMAAPTIKWNCVFAKGPVAPGAYHFTVYLVIGSLSDVRKGVETLCSRLGSGACVQN